MELGVYSFGDVQRNGKKLGSTSEGITNLLEAMQIADKVGLDFFGVGEHHTSYFPASSPGTILAAAAATTKQIKLGSAVSVLSTDDPVRIYQQFATANIISGGRVEVIAGRGSSTESFPLFGYELKDYDALYTEKLDLLLQLNNLDKNERITWEGIHRAPLQDAQIVPQSDDPLKIWLATGGNPDSSIRAAALGLPIAYAVIGGRISRFAPLVDLYHAAAKQYGTESDALQVSIASPGYIADSAQDAKETFWKAWGWTMTELGKVRGFAAPDRAHYDAESNHDGALFAGSADEIADRIIELHKRIGHSRHIFQMDVGQLPHDKFLHSIELLGTVVAPKVRKALASGKK
ncbi:luciferase [Candidatus Saccharibacteria bacterium RIFCSPHIGHO2_01_FULL_45_15]|nr:MAG: luciferase [Candidatus Saccharibacteria bacterium RIFCSPHIGHO2_01_FULL_45_15]OGL28684.1 MAG: luciferase [Candidatus Saccharibacteria bacterium RIFCSPHIGHO2_02_FULL_46_12]OGL31487.1 MAG: luciferase [Candidatus Saccharibacteria bacterium RIFCSPHIGHO2_12_FULL_44_22]